jgi:hypothetical protein
VRCYEEHAGEHIKNLGSILGSKEKWKTFLAPLPHPPHPKTLKEKKQGTLSAYSGLSIGCMKFFFPKEFVTVFSLG